MDNLKRLLFEKTELWSEIRDKSESETGLYGATTMFCTQILNAYFSIIVEAGLYDEYQEWRKERRNQS